LFRVRIGNNEEFYGWRKHLKYSWTNRNL